MIIDFGKFKNKHINEIDESYLKWGSENLSNPIWKEAFKSELIIRTSKKVMKTHANVLSKLSDRSYDPLIFGKDTTECITNISFSNNKIYKYLSTGTVLTEEYKPWYLNISKQGTKLKGLQFYNYINHIDATDYKELSAKWDRTKWFPRTIEEGYMILNGATLFKNMKATDVSLHSFDIETTGVDKDSSDAQVLLISNTVKRKGVTERRLFDIQQYEYNEAKMIEAWCSYVREVDCDVLLGHNIFGFDLSYLSRYPLHLGRDGSEIKFDEKVSKKRKDGSQSYEYYNAYIHGRTIIDTMFLSITYDVARLFPSYGLKQIEKHLNLVDDSRIEWDFEKNSPRQIFKNKDGIWDQFKLYCSQDSDSPIKLFEIMIPSFFYMNQSVPKTFQQMINEATGSQLDSIMIRSYLQDGNSIPKSSEKVAFDGAIAMGIPGVYDNVRKVDVIAEYPSIMLAHDVYDKDKDPNAFMLKILKYFREERVKNKGLFKQTQDSYYDDLQGSQKIFINSLYGFLGAGYLLFNYPEGAAFVTKEGREIIKKSILCATGFTVKLDIKKVRNQGKENEENETHWVLDEKVQEGKGYSLVNVDTDSISYTNGLKPDKDEFDKEIADLNSHFPEMIKFEDDGIYDKAIVSKAKNYILKKGTETKIKGSSFKSSNKEPALKEFQVKLVNEMLENNDLNVIKSIYKDYINEAKDIKDIKRWASKKTYTSKVQDSDRANETKVVDAINEGLDKGALKSIQQGDKIYLYQTIDGVKQKQVKGELKFFKKTGLPMMEPNKILRLADLYNNDADNDHYVKRVNATLEILENVLPAEEIISGT